MKNEKPLKTAILLGVAAAHIGLFAALDKISTPPEPVEAEHLTMVDLDAPDGGEAGAGSPPAAPKPSAPKPPPPPVKKPDPPKPKPKTVEKTVEAKPKIKAVVKDDAPPDIAPVREAVKPKIKPPKPKPEKVEPPEPKAPEIKPETPKSEVKPKLNVAAKRNEAEAKPLDKHGDKDSSSRHEKGGNQDNAARTDKNGNGNADGSGKVGNTDKNGSGGSGGGDKGQGRGDKGRGDGGGGDDDKPKRKPSGGTADGGYLTVPNPPYPEASRENGEEGTVKIKVLVEADGRVSDADIVSSSGHSRLDKAALRAAKSARYKPKKVDGEAVRTRFTAVYKFTIND